MTTQKQIITVAAVTTLLCIGAGVGYVLWAQQKADTEQKIFVAQLESLATISSDEAATPTNKPETIAFLKFINDNQKDVEAYLVAHHNEKIHTNLWSQILEDYVLVTLPGGYETEGLVGHSGPATLLELVTLSDRYGAPVIVNVRERPNGTFIADVDSMYISGAYNVAMSFYLLTFMGNSLSIKILTPLSIDTTGTISEYDIYNAQYSADTDVVEVIGMLPFGMYPCNPIDTFAIYPDRLIKIKEEEKAVCHGKDISSPDDVIADFSDSTDFSKLVPVYTVSASQIEKAVQFDLTTLSPREQN